MGKLAYVTNASLDGYIEDASGSFAFSEPDEELHGFFNELERGYGTLLYGRRLYETMVYWEGPDPGWGAIEREFAEVWQAADKVVYSTTLQAVGSGRTRLERTFDPQAIAALKAAADHDISIGGAELAAHAFRAGLVDEIQLVVAPAVVGGGKRALPRDVRLDLELLDERRFATGAVHLRYAVR